MKAIADSERKVAGENASPYALAQFLAIRDQFVLSRVREDGLERSGRG